jgi:hypothetical protein
VKHQLELIPTLWPPSKEYHPEVILTNIEKILQPVYRDYLRVFKLERNASLTNVIFQAAFSSITIYMTSEYKFKRSIIL